MERADPGKRRTETKRTAPAGRYRAGAVNLYIIMSSFASVSDPFGRLAAFPGFAAPEKPIALSASASSHSHGQVSWYLRGSCSLPFTSCVQCCSLASGIIITHTNQFVNTFLTNF